MDLGTSAPLTRTLSVLARLGAATLSVVVLSLGRPILMPIAAATALAFILTPPMKWFQRRLPRLPALALVMLLAAAALGSAGYVVASQLNDLTTQAGKYTESMRRKVAALQAGSSGPLSRVEFMFARITDGLERRGDPDVLSVHVVPARSSPAAHMWNLFRPLAEPLITFLFILVLCVFMLGRRDDLRNRLIRLMGTRNVTSTTRALDEGAQRITRYLLDQTIVNAVFGALVGAGLSLIGIPFAVLWGFVAALARFVPYLGSIASMLMPAALAFAIFPGWERALLTAGLFVGMDFLTAYAVEPLLFGRRTGVSPIALLVSALFWAWLWGPMGLALATPITVSLAVLGRHVPSLEFLAILLGDDPVIGAEISFYQRLLARDEDGAAGLARERQVSLGGAGVVDRIIIPTLVLASRDLVRKKITIEDGSFIVTWSRDIFEHVSRRAGRVGSTSPVRAVGVAAHGAESELLLEMLAAELAPEQGALEVLPPPTTPGDLVARVERLQPEVVCVAALPPEGGPYARRICRQLRDAIPGLRVLAFRPSEPGIDPAGATTALEEAGADKVVTTLAEASAEMARLLSPGQGSGSGAA